MSRRTINIYELSQNERLDLMEELWDSLSDNDRNSQPLTPEHIHELDRRLDLLDKEGPRGVSPEELRKGITRRPL